jgi:hypothetical protein
MKKFVLVLLILLVCRLSWAPELITVYHRIDDVRILGYSPKQPNEGSKLPNGKSARNEKGCAVPAGFLPYGTVVIFPGGIRRTTDDRTPEKAVRIIGTRKLIELRWYQSIKSKPKTRAVNREVRHKDMGWGSIWVEERIEVVNP